MRLLSMFILCLSAWAVDGGPETYNINGVSIGGTAEQPTIINGSDTPVLGYAVERITSNGVNHFFSRLSLENIVQGTPLLPGQEKHLTHGITNIGGGRINHVTGEITREGTPLRYELRAVLFANGTFVGPDYKVPNPDDPSKQVTAQMQGVFDEFAGSVSRMKAYAQSGKSWADMENDRAEYAKLLKPRTTRLALSVDWSKLDDGATVADIVLHVKAQAGEAEAQKALARVASMPDLVRGE